MALKIWFPLNGTLENKGLSNVTITPNNTTTYANGKIGQALNCNGSSYWSIENINLGNQASICCWTKTTVDGKMPWVLWSDACNWLNLWFYSGKYYLNTGDSAANPFKDNNNTISSFVDGNWHHHVVTWNGTETLLYIDGEYAGKATTYKNPTTTNNKICLAGNYKSGQSYDWNGMLNDFRVYDHCLSAKEVKEISQALVLHYKFDDGSIESSSNLITTEDGLTSTCYNGATGKYNYGTNTDMYKTVGFFNGKNCTKVYMGTNNLSAYPYVYFSIQTNVGETKTLSFDYYPTILDSIRFYNLQTTTALKYEINGVKGTATNAVTLPVNIGQWNHIVLTTENTGSANGGMGYMQIGAANHTSNTTNYWLFANVQVESKDHATPYMGVGGSRTGYVIDSSGYNHNGTLTNSPILENGSPRYENNLYLSKKKISCTSCIPTNDDLAFTISFWFKLYSNITYTSYADLISFNTNSYSSQPFRLEICGSPAGTNLMWFRGPAGASGGFNAGPSASGWYTFDEWHHLALVSNGSKQYTSYFDGQQAYTYNGSSNTWTPLGNLTIGDTIEGTVSLSDFRFYTTALSANDIKILYDTPTEIDKNGAWHTHQFTENGKNQISKTGLVENSASSEWALTKYLKYDPNIYIEPDGSAWVHIYHHNNPAAGSFASGDTFTNSVYKDANRWFNATQICNQLNKWEFMIKYCYTANGTIYKERWIQTKNPENAVFGDVDAADITRITGNGYNTGSWGGLYKKNASAYWVMNNGNSGNWWGATGSFSVYQGGIPGYGGSITSTGYNDLYVRIDNGITIADATEAQINKNNIYIGNSLIEK